jgi:indolepyruvate decarboxylase
MACSCWARSSATPTSRVSETKIDMRKTIQALDGRVTIGYHTYSQLPLAALVGRMLACVSARRQAALAVTPPGLPARPGGR